MVQSFTGEGLGISSSSLTQLGHFNPKGVASLGQSSATAYVNAANGNLVVQQRDGFLANLGVDFDLFETYNALGEKQGEWCFNTQTHLVFSENPDSLSIIRVNEDGHNTEFVFNPLKQDFKATDGSTATLIFEHNRWYYDRGDGQALYEYDTQGMLTALLNKEGQRLEFHYSEGVLNAITNQNNQQRVEWSVSQGLVQELRLISDDQLIHHIRYQYDAYRRLQTWICDLDNRKEYWVSYDYVADSNRLARIRQADGVELTLDYDSQGRVTQYQDGEGRITHYDYSTASTRITNGLGQTSIYYYDDHARLTRVENQNESLDYTYQDNHLVRVKQGQLEWQLSYNEQGDCIQIEEPSGQITARYYDVHHHLIRETQYTALDSNHQPIQPQNTFFIYDEQGHLRFHLSTTGLVTEYRYNSDGLCISQRRYQRTHIDTTVYLEAQPILSELMDWTQNQKAQAVNLIEYQYDWRGKVHSEIQYTSVDEKGIGILTHALITQTRYDAMGRLIEKSAPVEEGFATTYFVYDGLGRLTQTIDNQHHSQYIEYDDSHHRSIQVDTNGLETICTYDQGGLLLTKQQLDAKQLLGTVYYHYDAAGRLDAETHVDGKTSYFFYNDQDRLQAKINVKGLMTAYEYDHEGRLIKTIDYHELINTKTWARQSLDFHSIKPLLSVDDRVTETRYNSMNQVAYIIDAMGGVTGYQYNLLGKLVQKTAFALRTERGTELPIQIDFPKQSTDDRHEYYYYNREGLLEAEINGEGTAIGYRYDEEGHLVEECRYFNRVTEPSLEWVSPLISNRDRHTYYWYNAAGLKTAEMDADRYVITYDYNERGLLAFKRCFSKDVDYTLNVNQYTSINELGLEITANDHWISYRYNDLGQLIEEHSQSKLATLYTYNESGLVTSKLCIDTKTEERRAQEYQYNSQGQLIRSLDAKGAALLKSNLTQEELESIWTTHGMHYSYDQLGRLLSKTNALDQTTSFFYDEMGSLIYEVSAAGDVTEHHYNAFNELTLTYRYSKQLPNSFLSESATLVKVDDFKPYLIADPSSDEVIAYSYNNLGQMIKKIQGSREETFVYNAFGDVEDRGQGSLSQVKHTRYLYDHRGLVRHQQEESDHLFRDLETRYDVFGQVESRFDAQGRLIRSFLYDGRGNNTIFFDLRTDPYAPAKFFQYDAFNRCLSESLLGASMGLADYSFDDANQTLTVRHYSGTETNVTSIQYNAFGDQITVTDGRGKKTYYEYDTNGQVISIEGPEESIKTYQYNALGHLIWQGGNADQTIAYTYDALGRILTKTIDPLGLCLSTTYVYDGIGRQLEVTDAEGHCTQFNYNSLGFIIRRCQDPDGLHLESLLDYDERGLLVRETQRNPQGIDKIIAYEWDTWERRTATILDPDGLKLTTRYVYDIHDNLIQKIDSNGHSTNFIYDTKRLCRYQVDARGVVTEHRYDARGNEIQTIHYANRISQLVEYNEATLLGVLQVDSQRDQNQWRVFNAQGRLTYSFDALGFGTSYRYDSSGNLIAIARFNKPNSIEDLKKWNIGWLNDEYTRYQYFVYNSLNQCCFQIDGQGVVTEFRYNANHQLLSSTRYAKTLSDLDKTRLDQQTIEKNLRKSQDDQTVQYRYDKAGRLSKQCQASGAVIGYDYDGTGHCIATRLYATLVDSNSQWEEQLSLNDRDRVTRAIYDAAGREVFRISGIGRLVERRYDAVGNVIAEITHGHVNPSISYTVDALYNVLSGDNTVERKTQYHYDAVSRLDQLIDAQNQTTYFDYDANNNLVRKTEANGSQWNYSYDEVNQRIETRSPMIQLTRQEKGQWLTETRTIVTQARYDSFGNLTTEIRDAEGIQQTRYYEYDANNRRVKTIYPNLSLNAAKEPVFLREEQQKTLTEQTQYNAFGDVISTTDRAGDRRYFLYNTQGRLSCSLNAEHELISYRYDLFGNLIEKTSYATLLQDISDYSNPNRLLEKKVETAQDRYERYVYDKENRVIEQRKNAVRTYNPKTRHYDCLEPMTRTQYNAFGEVTLVAAKRNESEWAETQFYYNQEGKKIAELDAEEYLTTFDYNDFSELAKETQYAQRVNRESPLIPRSTSRDRTVLYEYDRLGHLIKKTFKDVEYQSKTEAGQRYQLSITDLTTHYTYDALGHLNSTTDAKGYTTYCYYDQMGQLIAKIGPKVQAGRPVTTYNYDALGQLVETKQWASGAISADLSSYQVDTSSQDRSLRKSYNELGQLISEYDGLNHEVNYSYDEKGQLVRRWELVKQIEGVPLLIDKRYTYDKEGRLKQTALATLGSQWMTEDFSYNVFGELIAKGVNGKYTTTFNYDQLGRVWRSNSEGFYQLYVYDLLANLTQVIRSTNAFREEYNENGIDLSTDSFESAIRFDTDRWTYDLQRQDNLYDGLGHLVQQTHYVFTTNLEERTQLQSTDRWGNVLMHRSVQGYETYSDYNFFNQVIRQELPQVITYNNQNQAYSIKPTQYYAYDELGRLLAVIDANGHTLTKEWDAQGHLIRETDAKGYHRDKSYNLLEQLTQAVNELGGSIQYTYDKNNRLITVTGGQSSQYYEYDDLGQLIAQTNGAGETQQFWYDTLGHQIHSRDANHHDVYTTYDDLGHKRFEQDANGNIQSWVYEEDTGRLEAYTDLGHHTSRYTYNKNGLLLTERSDAGKDLSYHYFANGSLKQFVDNSRKEVVDYGYDEEGHMISKTSSRVGNGNEGWIREIDHYSYDALGRLLQVRRRHPEDVDTRMPPQDHALLSIDYDYDAVGNIHHTDVAANYTGYSALHSNYYYLYDENNRLVLNKGQYVDGKIVITKTQGSELGYDAAGNLNEATQWENGEKQRYNYHYTQNNQLEWLNKNDRRLKTLTYDTVGRVTEERFFDSYGHALTINKMVYDKGLLAQQTTLLSQANQEKEVAKVSYSYDASGNLLGTDSINSQGRSLIQTHHRYTYALWSSYQQEKDQVFVQQEGIAITQGQSLRYYDVNGQLQESRDEQIDGFGQSNSTFYWVSSQEGIRARRDKQGQTNYLAVDGKTIGDLRLDHDGQQHLTVYSGSTLNQAADANLSQELIDSYLVKAGDTLESIALQVYGDSSLWYLIADTNGIAIQNMQSNPTGLRVGQRLSIPAITQGQHQTASTHRVLSMNELIGNTSATASSPMMLPSLTTKTTHYHFLSQLVVAVVSAVGMILAAAAMATIAGAPLVTGLGAAFRLGVGVLSGSVMGSSLGTLGASFVAGIAGSLAGQAASNVMHLQQGIDWHGLVLTGLATAASAGLLRGLKTSTTYAKLAAEFDKYSLKGLSFSSAAELMEQDVLSQSIHLAFEKHTHFDWVELGTKAIIGGVTGSRLGRQFNRSLTQTVGEGGSAFIQSQLVATTSGGSQSLIGGRHFDATQVLADNLGNAVSSSLIQSQLASEESHTESLSETAADLSTLTQSLSTEASALWDHYGDDMVYYGPKLLGDWGGTSSTKNKDLSLSIRLSGALLAAEGAAELGAASLMVGASEGLLAGVGYPVGLHGADTMMKGLKQVWQGEETTSQTEIALRKLGFSQQKATLINDGLSLLSIAGSSQLSRFALENYGTTAYSHQSSLFTNKLSGWLNSAKSINYGSILGNATLGAMSGAYGAIAAGGDKFDISVGAGLGVALGSVVHASYNTITSNLILGGVSDVIAQGFTMIHDPVHAKFSYISLLASAYGSGVAGHLTRYADPFSRMVIGSIPDAAINSIGQYYAQKY